MIASDMNEDRLILLNYFLRFMKSKLKNVWASTSDANKTNEKMAMD